MREPSRQCAFMAAAYPSLDAEDTCDKHRHEPRIFALAKRLAAAFQPEPISDEKVAWFIDDADAVVDDFGGPEWDPWVVADLGDDELPRGIGKRFTINGVEYVLPESEWEPSVPVKRETWDSWNGEESSPLPLHRTAANVGVVCSTCDGGGCPDCTDPA